MRKLMFVALVLVLWSGPVAAVPQPPADTYFYDLILDSDNDAATGCETHVQDDNIDTNLAGIDHILRAKVDFTCPGPAPRVTELERLECDPETGMFSHIVYNSGNWPVGNNNGVNGADVIEASHPVEELGLTTNAAKIAFRATGPDPNSDVLLTVDGTVDGALILLARWTSAPAASPAWLLTATILLITLGTWTARRRASRAAAIATFVVTLIAASAVTTWAGGISLDGLSEDWAGIAPLGNDALNDSTKNDDGEDIVAGFVEIGMGELYFRIDVKNLAIGGCG